MSVTSQGVTASEVWHQTHLILDAGAGIYSLILIKNVVCIRAAIFPDCVAILHGINVDDSGHNMLLLQVWNLNCAGAQTM